MLLYISDHKTVEDLQDRFNKCFPYLKLEFYREADNYPGECSKANMVKPHTLIGDLRRAFPSGVLDIKSWDKTARIKHDLEDFFGLHVQVFRRHKDQWIQTSYSDELTLKQQTELAREYTALC